MIERRKVFGWASQFTLFFAKQSSTPIPLLYTSHFADIGRKSDNLIVLLPGIMDKHSQFENAGFIDQARRQNLDADIILADTHIGYYVQKFLIERLEEDIIQPAAAAGYQEIWIGGASLGGLGVSLYASEKERDLFGAILIAPYLGEKSIIRQIEKAGGPQKLLESKALSPHLLKTWDWLSKYFEEPSRSPKLYLGYGENDKFAYSHSFLSEVLPSSQVIRIAGGHDWETWAAIWTQLLDRLQLN